MNGAEHYAEAERLLSEAGDVFVEDEVAADWRVALVARAQAHAVLAQVAATMDAALPLGTYGREPWREVLGYR